MNEDITLREYLELRLDAMDKALTLQAKEYERRLEVLNNEAARISAVQEKSVTAEKYEVQRLADTDARELALKAMSARVSALENWRSKTLGGAAVLMFLSGFIGAIVVKIIFKA